LKEAINLAGDKDITMKRLKESDWESRWREIGKIG
jgi:hypothetical protein